MRAIMIDSHDVVVGVIADLDGKTIDADGRAARGVATYYVTGPAGVEEVPYEVVMEAPPGGSIVVDEAATVGWRRKDGQLFPPPPPALSLDQRRAVARAECARRILARASANTQANMTAYATVLTAKPAGSRTASEQDDLAAYAKAIAWVAAMRARWPEIAAEGLDAADDANWPEPPAAAMALAARF